MAYFDGFPNTLFNGQNLTNITVRLNFLTQIQSNAALFQYFFVQDGDRPEDIAFQAYGDSNLYWIVLWLNNIIDPYLEWPQTSEQLMEYVQNVYGVENVYATHHYESIAGSNLPLGTWVNLGTPFSQAVTNFDYENNVNEGKRKIKLLYPGYLPQVLQEYNSALS
jgi:hypothetical protein